MREMDLVFRTMFAELAQQSLDAQFHADFPLEGRFVTVPVKGKDYFYFDMPTPEGKDKRSYVGPAADSEIAARVQRHRDIKARPTDDCNRGLAKWLIHGTERCHSPSRILPVAKTATARTCPQV